MKTISFFKNNNLLSTILLLIFLCFSFEGYTQFGNPLGSTGWYLSQDFGIWNSSWNGYHLGEDYVSNNNIELPVYAVSNGIVKHTGSHTGYGYVVIIEHTLSDNTKVCSVYGHLRALNLISQGGSVVKGDLIGYMSNNYSENGGYNFTHLHFGIRSGEYSTVLDSDGNWRYRGYGPDYIRNLWYDGSNFIASHQTSNPPTLTNPADNSQITKGSNISFTWSSVTNAVYYEIWIDNNSGFGSPEVGYNNGGSSNWVNNGIVSSTSFSLTTTMQNQLPQNLYYWRVRALDGNQNPITDWSSERSFTLLDAAPSPPTLTNPADNSQITKGSNISFTWSSVTNAVYYEIWIDNNSGFGSPEVGYNNGGSSNWVNNGIVSSTSFSLTTTMQNQLPQNLYYWRVRTLDGNQNPITDWSSERSFTLLDAAPSPPTLTNPADNSQITKGSNISFTWSSVTNAVYYEIWIDNNSGFGSPEVGYNNGGSSNWVNNGIVSSTSFSLTTTMQNQLPQNLYYWRVRALDGNQNPITDWSSERSFTLLDAAPSPPTLTNPADNSQITKGSNISFTWSSVTNAVYYEIWIDNNSGFGSPEVGYNNGGSSNWVNNGIVSSTSFSLTTTMQNQLPQNLYYWRVRALDGNQNPITDWSSERSFTLLDAAPSPPTLTNPADNSQITKGSNISFTWSSVTNAVYYEIWIDNNSGFGSPEVGYNNGGSSNWVNNGIVSSTSFSLTTTMQNQLPQNLYYWRVRALDGSQNPITDWSSERSFTLLDAAPSPPTLTNPADNSQITKGSNISFTWSSVTNAVYYEIWIDNNSGFGSPEVGYNNGTSSNWVNNGILDSTSFTLTTTMQNQLPQNLYYWRVRALDGSQDPLTDWSNVRSFTLLDTAPSPPTLTNPADNSQITKGSNISFTWSSVTNAVYYEIWIDNNSGFGSPEVGYNNGTSSNWVNNGIVDFTSFTLTTTMQNQLPQNLYYWRVRALDGSQDPLTDWSNVRSFTLLDQVSINAIYVSISGSDNLGNGSFSNPYKTIQYGIDVANNGDTVVVLTNSSYNENICFDNKSIYVTSMSFINNSVGNYITDYDILPSIVGDGSNHVVQFINGASSILIGFKISNGNYNFGGGIYSNNSSPKLKSLWITNNQATYGSAIDFYQSNALVYNCKIENNSTFGVDGSGTINCKASTIRIINSILNNNETVNGAGLSIVNSSNVSITNSLLFNNNASNIGGAISANGANESCTLNIINSTITNNNAMIGSGINNNLCEINITNSIIWNNDMLGGGSYNCSYSNFDIFWNGNGNIFENPLFVDTTSFNFTLCNNSPCINAGNPDTSSLNLPVIDLLNNPRIDGIVNIGCFETESNCMVLITNIEKNKIFIYPNPVSNELIIEIKGNTVEQNFQIINSIGQVVFKGSLVEKTIVHTHSFAQGIYIIKLENGNSFEFMKIIKQ